MFILILVQAMGLLITAVISADKAGIDISSIYTGFIILTIQTVINSIFTVVIFCQAMKSTIMDLIIFLKEMSQSGGDLSRTIFSTSGDELSEMAKHFNQFIQNLRDIIKEIINKTGRLDSSSGNLFKTAGFVSKKSGNALRKSDRAAVSSDLMKNKLVNIAETINHASLNIDMVAAATEQMSHTITEISQNTETTRDITQKAVAFMDPVKKQAMILKTATKEVSEVTEVITDISDQINLLALNASIESSRAGEYGRGFAVVASEIKQLAKKTSDSTKKIKSKIDSIKTSTSGTIEHTNRINNIIVEISEIVMTTSSAVEEQAVSMRDIARNTEDISTGNREINTAISQISNTSMSIADDIAEANGFITELTGGSVDVNQKAKDLADLSDQLKKMTCAFKV